jgi:hypothetical protein
VKKVLLLLALAPRAWATEADAEQQAAPTSEMHFVGDVRGILLFRAYEDYNRHAHIWGYDLPDTAGGISATLGAQVYPRWTILAGGQYVLNGSDRGDAHLRIASGGGMLLGRFAAMHSAEDNAVFDFSVVGGIGRYAIRETYVNPDLSAQVFVQNGGGFGGQGGVEASLVAGVFRLVLAYAYHYSPASISDRIGGVVYAGGHEISLGVGVRL